MLNFDRANELFLYDEEAGCLVRKVAIGNAKVGDVVNSLRSDGYLQVSACGGRHMVHRVVWLMLNGGWPSGLIDHKDGDKLNNRRANLRLADKVLNAQNIWRPHRDNANGLMGVSFIRGRVSKPFRSEIRHEGGQVNLGTFAEAEEAHIMYCFAKHFFHSQA